MKYLMLFLFPNLIFASFLFPKDKELNIGAGISHRNKIKGVPLVSFKYGNFKFRGSQAKYYRNNSFMKISYKKENQHELHLSDSDHIFYGIGHKFKYAQLTFETDPFNLKSQITTLATSIPVWQLKLIPKVELLSKEYICDFFSIKSKTQVAYTLLISLDVEIYRNIRMFNIIGGRYLKVKRHDRSQEILIIGAYYSW